MSDHYTGATDLSSQAGHFAPSSAQTPNLLARTIMLAGCTPVTGKGAVQSPARVLLMRPDGVRGRLA